MIYLKYSKSFQKQGHPEYRSCKTLDDVPKRDMHAADYIFMFENGNTVYYKIRYDSIPNGYQYSDEEKVVLALRSVLI